MEMLASFFVSMFVFISMISIYFGLNLRKWPSWVLGAYGLATGFFCGRVWSDNENAFVLGALFAFGVLSSGAMIRWHRMTWDGETVVWPLRPETKKRFPLLSRFFGWFL